MWYSGVEAEYHEALKVCSDGSDRCNISCILVCSIMHSECDIEYTKYVIKKYFHSVLFSVFSENNSDTIWIFAQKHFSVNQHELPISMCDMKDLAVFASSIKIKLSKTISKIQLYEMSSDELSLLVVSVDSHKGNDFIGTSIKDILPHYYNRTTINDTYMSQVKSVTEAIGKFNFISEEYKKNAIDSVVYAFTKGNPNRPAMPKRCVGSRFTMVDIIINYYGVPVKETKLYRIVRKLHSHIRKYCIVYWKNEATYVMLREDNIVELSYYFLHNKIFDFDIIVIPNTTAVVWEDIKKFNLVKNVFGFNTVDINSSYVPVSFLSEEYND